MEALPVLIASMLKIKEGRLLFAPPSSREMHVSKHKGNIVAQQPAGETSKLVHHMLHVIASGMDKQEEELGRGGGGGVLVGLAGLGELPPGNVWPCLTPVDGRDQEPLPIWDSNTDSHFRRALSQVRVLVVRWSLAPAAGYNRGTTVNLGHGYSTALLK